MLCCAELCSQLCWALLAVLVLQSCYSAFLFHAGLLSVLLYSDLLSFPLQWFTCCAVLYYAQLCDAALTLQSFAVCAKGYCAVA